MSGVGSSPALATCETRQVLLGGVSGGFPGLNIEVQDGQLCVKYVSKPVSHEQKLYIRFSNRNENT